MDHTFKTCSAAKADIAYLWLCRLRLRITAPVAMKRAAFQKNQCSDSGAIMDRIMLNIENCSIHSLQTVFCPPDYLILKGFAHFNPVCRESGYPDHKVAVLLRMQLRIKKHSGIDHIKLNLKSWFFEIGFDKGQ